jgi:hypothetical protein
MYSFVELHHAFVLKMFDRSDSIQLAQMNSCYRNVMISNIIVLPFKASAFQGQKLQTPHYLNLKRSPVAAIESGGGGGVRKMEESVA